MSAGLVILLLVPAGEGNTQGAGPTSARANLVAGVVAAAGRSLGPSSRVLVDEETKASDEAALALADRLHANGVVTLQWLEGNRVALHAHWAGRSGWTDRFFTFNANDAADERGRTIGFTLAAMAQEEAPMASQPDQLAGTPAPSKATPSLFHVTLEASAQAQAGDHATSFGGLARVGAYPVQTVAVTASVAWRAGRLGAVDGDLRTWAFAGGLRVPIFSVRAYELSLQAEGIASHEAVTRTNALGQSEDRGRWVPGMALALSGAWWAWPRFGFAVALGAQVNFGSTDVVVLGRTAATISPYRATGELGVRWRF